MFWFNKQRGIHWIAESPYTFQEGSWSLDTVNSLICLSGIRLVRTQQQ